MLYIYAFGITIAGIFPAFLIRWLSGRKGIVAGMSYYIAAWILGAYLFYQAAFPAPGGLSALGAVIGTLHLSGPKKYTVFRIW